MPDYYGTISGADDYHAARGNGAVWDAASVTDDDKTAALLVASEWLDQHYGGLFSGYPTNKISQLRAWPRAEAFDIYENSIANTAIPTVVEYATYEAALRQITSPGALFTDWVAGKDIKSVSVDGAVSVTYAGAVNVQDVQLTIPKINGILRPVLTGSLRSAYSGKTSR